MVYSGRPSKGCAPCRAKRTKCDQARPYCGQCRRARRECPGYRAEQDTIFRNETSKFVTKAQAGTTGENNKRVSPIPSVKLVLDDRVGNSVTVTPVQVVNRTNVAIRGLSLPLEDDATYYFFHNFVSEDPASLTAYSHVLPTVYRQNSSSSALPNIIQAIGLAGISNVKRAPELMVTAGQKYARVLRAITASLQHPKEASTDQTLIAVMLLGLFETVTCSNPESMRSWTNHVSGATALARLRGADQLRTTLGRRIFDNVVVQILIDCLQRRLMVPLDVIEWAEIAAGGINKRTVHEQQLLLIIARLCTLRATVDRADNSDIGVVTLANLIDSDLEDWKNSLPPAFSFSIEQSANTADAFSGTYHIYSNTWVTSFWNLYRCARILTQQVITTWLSRNSMPNAALDEAQRRRSEVLLASLAYDICATAPFMLGASKSSGRSSRPPRAAAGASLLWPFYLVATMEQQSTGMRAWVITRLGLIGRTMGIKQAESLANVLRIKREITAWDKFETARADEVFDDW